MYGHSLETTAIGNEIVCATEMSIAPPARAAGGAHVVLLRTRRALHSNSFTRAPRNSINLLRNVHARRDVISSHAPLIP